MEILVKQNIRDLSAYQSARHAFNSERYTMLDANENPYGKWNRYPDPLQLRLRKSLASNLGLKVENLFCTNGSDEGIDLAIRLVCKEGRDELLTVSPSYGMYKVLAQLNGIACKEVKLNENFQFSATEVLDSCSENTRLIVLCSPNNPTGIGFDDSEIEKIVSSFNGMVLIDEAYIEFSNRISWLNRLGDFPNLLVCQTFSKSAGLAALRLGVLIGNEEVISYLLKMKFPYNVNKFSQETALKFLNNREKREKRIKKIVMNRERLRNALKKNVLIDQVYPSEANFILLKSSFSVQIHKRLQEKGLLVRYFSDPELLRDMLRISIGTKKETKKLIQLLKQLENEKETIDFGS